jgi:hypothetical protein
MVDARDLKSLGSNPVPVRVRASAPGQPKLHTTKFKRVINRHLVAAALLAAMLSACTAPGGNSDDSMARFFVAPDRFVLFNCEQLATRAATSAVRIKELQALMTKAGVSSDGRLASAIAYRPEYVSLRSDMNELRRAAAEKNCKSMPALDYFEGRASDNAVR